MRKPVAHAGNDLVSFAVISYYHCSACLVVNLSFLEDLVVVTQATELGIQSRNNMSITLQKMILQLPEIQIAIEYKHPQA
jgi:hypothetical protein